MTALARLALRFRTVTLLIVGLLLVGGVVAVTALKQELFPSIEVPYIVVSAAEPGAGPNEVAADIAAPIEEAISTTQGLRHVTSTSLEGAAIVAAEYDFGTDMDAIQQEVRESLAGGSLPPGVTPRVERISPDSFPIYSVAVSGADQEQVQSFVSEDLGPALRSVRGVAEVTVAGGSNRIVSVVADPVRLDEAGLSISEVVASLKAANVSIPVGGVVSEGTQFPVRVAASIAGIEQVERLMVAPAPGSPGAEPVPLDSVAEVALTQGGAGASISRFDGVPAITLEVIKAQDANTVDSVEGIEEALDDVPRPEGIRIDVIVNQAPEIRTAVSDLARDAVIGAVLAIIMILVFLRNLRGTLVSGVSIPLSLLVAFIIMRADSISLNILTLGALSVAAGRVIDDAIVVFENIHRLMDEEHLPKAEAVLKGTSQMVPAITASTITTVAVFLPLAFVGGLVGEVFVGFALTVTFALLASLLVAVTVVPVLAQTFLKPHAGRDPGDVTESRMRSFYRRPLVWALRHRGIVVGAAALLLVGSLLSLTAVPTVLFPSTEPKALKVALSAHPGTSLEATSSMVAEVEAGIAQLDDVERFTSITGTTQDPLAALQGGGGGGASSATITVDLGEDAAADALASRIESLAEDAGLVGAASPVSGEQGPESSNLSMQVTGRDFAAVTAGAELAAERLGRVDGLEDVSTNVAAERPELVVTLDQRELAAFGLDPTAVAERLRTTLTPLPTTTTFVDGEPTEVVVMTHPAAVADPAALAALPLGGGVALGDVGEIEELSSPTAVTRYDGQRSVEIKGTITDENIGRVNLDVQSAVDDVELPSGVDVTLGGATEIMNESFSSLLTAMAIAVALVYLAMVTTFGSLLTPFVILFSLPLAAIGAFPALLVTGRELGLPAMLGLLMLIGIVVTNAIVMLEFVERLKREESMSTFEALVEGASTRLRPILMTAIVTVLALSPLALGLSEGALLSASLATVVIGGLLSSTLLTLFVIPAFYSLFDGLRRRFTRAAGATTEGGTIDGPRDPVLDRSRG